MWGSVGYATVGIASSRRTRMRRAVVAIVTISLIAIRCARTVADSAPR